MRAIKDGTFEGIMNDVLYSNHRIEVRTCLYYIQTYLYYTDCLHLGITFSTIKYYFFKFLRYLFAALYFGCPLLLQGYNENMHCKVFELSVHLQSI